MKKAYIFLYLLTVFFTGCDFGTAADNGSLKIKNNTSHEIRVYYQYEEESGSSISEENSVDVIGDVTVVGANSSKTIKIQSSFLYSGDIDAVYAGIKKHYDISFDFFDQAEKTINESDFFSLVQ
ncbi:MAG: hypothetical protein JW982_12720 [Spirochaetes bacterium]|nr:hypothetical protein [Spirochaetota bacterium]